MCNCQLRAVYVTRANARAAPSERTNLECKRLLRMAKNSRSTGEPKLLIELANERHLKYFWCLVHRTVMGFERPLAAASIGELDVSLSTPVYMTPN